MSGLRIIGGQCKGRKLASLPGLMIRPTSGLVRESIFNIIGSRVTDTTVLDLFAGTGALGLEALSRGAARVVFVDHSRQALALTRKNIVACGFQERTETCCRDATRDLLCPGIKQTGFDLIFMDPPYNRGDAVRALKTLNQSGILTDTSLIVVEHAVKESLDGAGPDFRISDRRKYGDTLVSFLQYHHKGADE